MAQHFVEPALGLAGEQRYAQRGRAIEIGIDAVEHRDRARDVEPADRHRDAALAQRAGDIERARELVRLHADQDDHAAVALRDQLGQTPGTDARIGLVEGVDDDLDVLAEDAALGAIAREPRQRRQRVRRNGGAIPLDDIAIVIVMGRLDQDEHVPPGASAHDLVTQGHQWWNDYLIAVALSMKTKAPARWPAGRRARRCPPDGFQ